MTRTRVLDTALETLAKTGRRGLTMRGLAQALSVTPMALYHHVGNRQALITALIAHVFGDLCADPPKDMPPLEQLRALLITYCERAYAYPELILLVFEDQQAFSGPLPEITDRVRDLLGSVGVSGSMVEADLGLLIDYTHGFALSLARAPKGAPADAAWGTYLQTLDRLLLLIARGDEGGPALP